MPFEGLCRISGYGVEVLRLETLRVRDAALRTIIDGLGMLMTDVQSSANLYGWLRHSSGVTGLTLLRCMKDTSTVFVVPSLPALLT